MAFDVDFYIFAKEVNSTARPSPNDKLTKSCKANGRIDIINPTISLQLGLGGTNSPAVYNYCYIQNFGRYYFIENWEWEGGLWTAHCAVDVLATYKTQIGNMRAYVLRSAEEYDGTINDGLYPAKNSYSYHYVANTGDKEWINNLNNGTYVVGILGDGVTKFYAFSRLNLSSFIRYLLSDTYARQVVGAWGFQVDSETKAIIDPLQYITSVTFFPISFTSTTFESLNIKVGYVDSVSVTAAEIDKYSTGGIDSVENVSFEFAGYQNHPYYNSRGSYLNYAPWTRRYLYIPPFGMIELDCTELGLNVYANIQVDMINGSCRLHVYSQTNILITELKTQLGVPIQLSQVIAKGMGTLTIVQKIANLTSQVMGGITGGGGTGGMIGNIQGLDKAAKTSALAAGSAVGGLASGISGTAGFIKDAIESKIPVSHSIGSMGGMADLYGKPYIFSVFVLPVEESRNTRGRPLCQERLLSTLASDNFSGYLLIADPDITNIAATATERDAIASFMTGGFYLA